LGGTDKYQILSGHPVNFIYGHFLRVQGMEERKLINFRYNQWLEQEKGDYG